MTARVLILLRFGGGYPSAAMHDFADEPPPSVCC